MQVPMDKQLDKAMADLPMAPHPVRGRRSRSGLAVRLVYGAGVIAVGCYFAWYFGRALLFLEGAGQVTAPVYDVSTPYLSQVVHMNVTPGIAVEEGDLIATVTSPQLDREIGEFERLLVEQGQKEADLRIRLRIALATRDLAHRSVDIVEEAFSRLDSGANNTTSLSYRMDVYRERALARLQEAQSEAEADEVSKQLERLESNRRDIRIKIQSMRDSFGEGEIKAQVDGIIGNDLVHTGEVIKPGDRIAEIYDVSESYILWHLPAFSLRQPQVADKVYVHYGSRVLPAYVYEVQHIAQPAPSRNQSLLREREQQQVALVKLVSSQSPLPINAQVTVRMNYSEWLETITRKLFGNAP